MNVASPSQNWVSKSILQTAKAMLMIAAVFLPMAAAAQSGGEADTYRVLYGFKGQPDGALPIAGVIRDQNGNLYGTTQLGGTGTCSGNFPGCGTVFSVDPNGKETVLYGFAGHPTDGESPRGALVRDATGNLYGTTYEGGTSGFGTVFELDSSGKETVLYNFTGGAGGSFPLGSLIQDANGNLYGTSSGNSTNCAIGCGTVFKLDTAGKFTVLHAFMGPDGDAPLAGLTMDAAGNLYGTTSRGGTSCNGGCGVVFKLDPSGKETVLHSFKDFPDGAFPVGDLTRDAKGNLYGTTSGGGFNHRYCNFGCGTIFKLAPTGKETVLYRFPALSTGVHPSGSVILDPAGNLYGTTDAGGDTKFCGQVGCGVVFKLSKTAKLTILRKFSPGSGSHPTPTLVRDASGTLYGTADGGGSGNGRDAYGCGVVFKLTP
jgi:uncharacterized repeat protein (TIGR03803 family)